MPGRALPRYVRPARAMRMQVKKGGFSRGFGGRDATEGTLHLEVVEGFAAFEGVSRWNHRHSTYLRPTRAQHRCLQEPC